MSAIAVQPTPQAAALVELPTVCGQCALFFASHAIPGWGCCKRTEETRQASALACPTGEIDCPF